MCDAANRENILCVWPAVEPCSLCICEECWDLQLRAAVSCAPGCTSPCSLPGEVQLLFSPFPLWSHQMKAGKDSTSRTCLWICSQEPSPITIRLSAPHLPPAPTSPITHQREKRAGATAWNISCNSVSWISCESHWRSRFIYFRDSKSIQSDLCWVKLEFGWKLYRMGQLLLICTLYWILIWVSSVSHAAGLTCWKVDSWLSEKLLGRSRPTLVLQQATTGQGVCRNNASMEVLCYVEIKVIISVLEKGGCKRSIVNCMR